MRPDTASYGYHRRTLRWFAEQLHECRKMGPAIALTAWTEPVLARSYLNCLATKVVIINAVNRSTSSSVQEHLGFWIDEAAKTIMLANGTSLTVRRFDDHWISAALGGSARLLTACQRAIVPCAKRILIAMRLSRSQEERYWRG